MKNLARQTKRIVARSIPTRWRNRGWVPASADYAIIDPQVAGEEKYDGWRNRDVAIRQDAAFHELIQQMYVGRPRRDLLAAAEAIRCTGVENPSVLEVGCGSGYYSEILSHLLGYNVQYLGVDYSTDMIHLAAHRYPSKPFVVGDATSLAFDDNSFDLVFNGVSLMHILNYPAAIAESSRVARSWCIFHTVPVQKNRETMVLRKRAYGEPTIEVIYNEIELHLAFEKNGLKIEHILDSISYNLDFILNVQILSKTYVCKIDRG